ncbi:arginine kinase-like [Drosophila madeirensis]
MSGAYKGGYLPLCGMEKSVQQKLIDEHFLFKEGDRFLETAGASRFWPAGRGIYFNEARNFLVWVNEEDHIRIISMEKGGDIGKVYDRMLGGVEALGKYLDFSRDERLGYLTFCPTNLGTTIRASVHIKLPNLTANPEELQKLATKYNLQVRGTSGEHSEAKGGVHDISNKRRMGLTEYEAVKEMHDGISALIEAENKACKK